MTKSLEELRKELARARSKKQLDVDMNNYERKKSIVKKELFKLKHEKSLGRIKTFGRGIKVAGGNLKSNFLSVNQSIQKQRRKKKGVGGWLQRIADNQR